MDIKKRAHMLALSIVGGAALAANSPATALIEAGLQSYGPITTLSSPVSIPTSMAEAIAEDFYFIFDSFYQEKEGGAWVGERVRLNRFLNVDCRLQLGGYFWVEGDKPQDLFVAVTHGITTKPTPIGDPNDSACSGIRLEFNNGYVHPGFPPQSAGAWVGSINQLDLDDDDIDFQIPAIVYNVQVNDGILGYCTANGRGANGRGGDIGVDFNNNGVGVPASFDFDDNITNPPLFTPSCRVIGKLFSVLKDNITMPEPPPGLPSGTPAANTPGTTNPSPTSFDKIDYVIRIP